MCGIGGILRTDGQPIPEEWLDIIDARIAYRGPDGCGRFRDRVEIADENAPSGKRVVEVAFVHRRLSIIDHAGGHQPMVSERGRNDSEGLVAVVFNGCIYNHRELRKELEGKGHTFVTDHSDTEVLIHGWREWREELPNHLEGMYAFAVWDRSHSILYLARDPFGEKPLLYAVSPNNWLENETPIEEVAFASALPALNRMSVHPAREPNAFASIDEYLTFGYIPAENPRGFGDTVCELHAAEGICFHPVKGGLPTALHSWRDLSRLGKRRRARRRERTTTCSSAELEALLITAIDRRLEADVPLGCFLSGGVDSSLIALLAKRYQPNLMTFTVRMPDARYDESAYAEEVASVLDVRHTTLHAEAHPASDLINLIKTLGEPFGDSSILPTYWVSRAARQHVKVALSGDGGDELFVGYERYLAARHLSRWHHMMRELPLGFLQRLHPKRTLSKVARFVDMAHDYQHVGIAAMESIFTRKQIIELLPHDAAVDAAGAPPYPCDSDFDALEGLRQFDIENYLPGDLLRKVDTASMACGLEVRCPFLDRDLARAALSMPIEQLMPGGQRKGLLRNIARKYLPKEIVDRPKMGFAIPIGEWFRSDYGQMKTLLLDHLNSTEPFGPIQLNRKAVQRFIDEHMSGKRDHGQRLFTLLTLSIWARQVKKNPAAGATVRSE